MPYFYGQFGYGGDFYGFSSSTPSEPVVAQPTANDALRKHLPPSMKGDVWAQLLATLGDEEQFAWDQAAAVYDQLFLVSAEGKYLDARASEEGGYLRPELVGLTDDVFRDLVIQLSTRKLTLNAFLRILEIYYGLDVVRAHVRTTTAETFVIADGDEQVFTIDGIGPFTVVFHAADFTNVASATAIETAIALNRGFAIVGAKALALPFVDSQTGLTYLTVYTASRGFKGSIEAVSGPLHFPAGRQTVQTQARAAYVKAIGGTVEVVLPATSIVVSREPVSTAAYVNGPTSESQAVVDNLGNPIVDSFGNPVVVGHVSSAAETNGVLVVGTLNPHGLVIGDEVFIDGLLAIPGSTNQCTPNGIFTVASTPDSNHFSVLIAATPGTGTQSFFSDGSAIMPLAATIIGDDPYLHDPTTATVITETTTTLGQPLEASHRYPTVQVASTVGFPDEKGFVVFGFGFDYQVGPVPYLGVSGSNQLLLDPAFTIPAAVPNGATVNLAARMSDDQVPHGDGDFWVTPSPAGRVSCESNLDDIAAGGRNVTKTVAYPGDVGLGGAGRPTHGVARLTDAVEVWGGDDLDAEVAAAREN